MTSSELPVFPRTSTKPLPTSEQLERVFALIDVASAALLERGTATTRGMRLHFVFKAVDFQGRARGLMETFDAPRELRDHASHLERRIDELVLAAQRGLP